MISNYSKLIRTIITPISDYWQVSNKNISEIVYTLATEGGVA